MGHDPLFRKHYLRTFDLNWPTEVAETRESLGGTGREGWEKEYEGLAQVQNLFEVSLFTFKIYPTLALDIKQNRYFSRKSFPSPRIIKQMLQGHMLCSPRATSPAKDMHV